MKLTDEEKKSAKKAYDKAYRKANKERIQEHKRLQYIANKEKADLKSKKYYVENKERDRVKRAAANKILYNSEGIGVYKAEFPSGVYIGEGQLYSRRVQHLNGNSVIAKTLNEKAAAFEVLFLTNTKEESMIKESEVIEQYGLDNLLNTKY